MSPTNPDEGAGKGGGFSDEDLRLYALNSLSGEAAEAIAQAEQIDEELAAKIQVMRALMGTKKRSE